LDGGALVADPNNNLVYYSGGDYYDGVNYQMAVSKSTNGGGAWMRSVLTAGGGFTYALAVDPSNSNVVYAGGNPGLFKSTNGGSSWALSSTGLSGTVSAIGINPLNCNILYAGTDVSMFKSTDGGANWSDCGLDYVQAVLVHPSAPETVFAGTTTGVYRSANAGGSWTAMSAGLDNLDVSSLGINPGYYLFCGTRGCGMYTSSLAIGVEEQGKQEAANMMLRVYPNPSAGNFTIKFPIANSKYQMNAQAPMILKIYNANGRLVKSFNNMTIQPFYQITWSGSDDTGRPVPAGIYFCRLEGEKAASIEKIILLR
jgi:photosystem II stability/assembly factor-like uncharacterized protein